jgi:hypothetical protein
MKRLSCSPTGSSTDGSFRQTGETAIAKMLSGLVDWAMLIAARAVNLRLEPEGRDLAERHEGQRVEHPPKVGIGGLGVSPATVLASTISDH